MQKEINLLSLNLHVLTNPFTLGSIKINDITSPKYPIQYLQLVFVSNNFEITALSKLTSQLIFFFAR